MEQNSDPFQGNKFSPNFESTTSLLSNISTRRIDVGTTQQPSTLMMTSESINSLKSDASNKSTFTTAANFISSHAPHIHGHHHNNHNQDLDHSNDDRRPHHLLPNTRHHPFSLLTKSFTQSEFDELHQLPSLPLQKIPAFIKSLKKSHTLPIPTNSPPLSRTASIYGGGNNTTTTIDNESVQIDDNSRPPPSSLLASPLIKPARAAHYKIQKEKLINQYQFFTKFQSNAKRSDAIYYAPLRLESMNEFLLEVYDYARLQIKGGTPDRLRGLTTVSEKSSIAGSTTSLNRYLTLTNSLAPNDFETIQPVSSAGSARTSDTANSKNESLSVSAHITPEKTRILLMQLWVIQAWKMLIGSSSLIVPQIRTKAMINFETHAHGNRKLQICCLQNQFNQSNYPTKDAVFDESELNWSIGWQLAHDEPHSCINSVFLTDWDLTPKIILDNHNVGQVLQQPLSDDLNYLQSSPIVGLSKNKKLEFFPNYSLFTTVSYKVIPLKTASQDIVYCHDLECSVLKEDWVPTLKEVHRVLVPGGHVQFVIKNLEVFSETKDVAQVNEDTPASRVWKLIRENAKNSGFEIRPCGKILNWLKLAGFKDVKYSLVCAPKTVTPIKGSKPTSYSTDSSSTPSRTTSEHDLRPSLKNSSSSLSMPISTGHKTSFYKDERLNNFAAFLSGLTEFSAIRYFTNLQTENEKDNSTLLEYFDYRNYGDDSGKIFYDEGYGMFMVVTAKI